ncbi:MAG TPA: aminotransferase class III-fold pyridoxal phosphate-dependent enzyme, partial [Conexibacter sp.]|nr:aminotransferase class III-fold pyridoxal phosphate-dependent enzyme [Conexibacter sp.]
TTRPGGLAVPRRCPTRRQTQGHDHHDQGQQWSGRAVCHPVSAAVALKSIEIFERDGVLENVRANEAHLEGRLAELRALPIVGDTRGRGYFWAMELVGDSTNRTFDKPERDRLLRGFLPGRLLDAGLIARADDRGDSVLQIAPPLISDRAVLDEIVDRLAEVLTDAGRFMDVESAAATATA